MDAGRKAKVGRLIRLAASEGWAAEDLEIDTDWHDRAVRLVQLVAAHEGGSDQAVALAKDMLEDLDAVEGGA